MTPNHGQLIILISLIVWICNSNPESTVRSKRYSRTGKSTRTIDILCNHGYELCADYCFNPAVQLCLENTYGQKMACNINSTLCGEDCVANYDTSHACVDDRLCLIGQAVCNGRCYSPQTHHCVNGGGPCVIGEVLCGYNCYNPENKSKTCHNSSRSTYLCNANEMVCGFSGCYNPEIEKCEGNLLCRIQETRCGFRCMNTANGEICLDDRHVCKEGEALCGSKCYSPSNEEVCYGDKLVCKTHDKICGTKECYDPASGQTCYADGSTHVLCGSGLDYCDYNCYDNKTQNCLHPEPDSTYGKICPKGYLVCKVRVTYYAEVHRCYDPSTQVCITSDHGNAICNMGQEVCGTNCYDPTDIVGHRCFEEPGIVCKTDEEVCGKICYNNATKTCLQYVSHEYRIKCFTTRRLNTV